MELDEISFLRDQVQRLNAELSQYQTKYPPLTDQEKQEVSDAPWLTDKSLMSPLLYEYDTNIQVQKDLVEEYKAEQRKLRQQVDKLVAENARLTRELKDSIESQLLKYDGTAPTETTGAGVKTSDDEHLLHNLQEQLQLALQEKESAMEMWQSAVQEVERMEGQLQEQQLHPRMQAVEAQAHNIKAQYGQTVVELNAQIARLQGELQGSNNELRIANIQVTELRHTLDELGKQLVLKDQEKKMTVGIKEHADHHAAGLERQTTDLQSRLIDASKQVDSLKRDRKVIEKKLQEAQKKSVEYEQEVYEMTVQMKESEQLVETAMLDKDQALVRERQSVGEVQRLQASLASLLDEAGARTRQEVDTVRKQCNDNISRLMEDLHNLEMSNTEKQTQIERAVRDKRSAESELEKLYKEGLTQGNKDSRSYDELNTRACNAERLRDEARLKMEAAESQMSRMEITNRQTRTQLEGEIQQQNERFTMLNQEFDDANDDRIKLVSSVDDLKRQLQTAQQERDAANRNLSRERACLERELQQHTRESSARLRTAEEGHRKTALELRQMLADQRSMCTKWKEECSTISKRYEVKVADLREEIAREKNRTEELTKLLRDSRDRTVEVEQMLVEYTSNLKRLEGRVRDAETRANNATVQASRIKRDKNIVEERKFLKRQLEKSLQESRNLSLQAQDSLSHSKNIQPSSVNGLETKTFDDFEAAR